MPKINTHKQFTKYKKYQLIVCKFKERRNRAVTHKEEVWVIPNITTLNEFMFR